jgi:hypothetical protein
MRRCITTITAGRRIGRCESGAARSGIPSEGPARWARLPRALHHQERTMSMLPENGRPWMNGLGEQVVSGPTPGWVGFDGASLRAALSLFRGAERRIGAQIVGLEPWYAACLSKMSAAGQLSEPGQPDRPGPGKPSQPDTPGKPPVVPPEPGKPPVTDPPPGRPSIPESPPIEPPKKPPGPIEPPGPDQPPIRATGPLRICTFKDDPKRR